jgi:hypothetical protein
MENVRAFSAADVGDVARLWAKVFAPNRAVSLGCLEQYLTEVFLGSPWSDPKLSSLIYEDSGQVVGFMGVLPRRMYFSGQPVTVAVASQLMLDPSKRRPFAPIELLRQFFAGPQDLSFSDGANDKAQQLWESAGGSIAMLYSSVWTRVLRPAGYAMTRCEDKRFLRPVSQALHPLGWMADSILTRWNLSPYLLSKPRSGTAEPVTDPSVFMDCVGQFSADRTLRPEYDLSSFQWLIGKAMEQKTHGELQLEIVRDGPGEIVGCYAYYVRAGRTAQVLQFAGKPRHRALVLGHLFYRAHQKGAVAVSGQLEPAFARLLSQNHCLFTWSGGVLIQSRHEKLLNAIHHGDASLSRLDGEWWMKFCDLAAA